MRLVTVQLRVVPRNKEARWPKAVGACSGEAIERATEEFKARTKRARFTIIEGGRAS